MNYIIENWYKNTSLIPSKKDLDYFTKNPWFSVDSSFISAIAYHELAEVLEVRLKDGKRYTFVNVPKKVYKAFLKAPSKGVFFNQIVKQNYKLS